MKKDDGNLNFYTNREGSRVQFLQVWLTKNYMTQQLSKFQIDLFVRMFFKLLLNYRMAILLYLLLYLY